MEWGFYQQGPTDNIRNPISGEFFSTEAVGETTEALIRESIQNTLDARTRQSDNSPYPAKARIYLSEIEGAMHGESTPYWFGSLWDHVSANKNGLRGQPLLKSACPFIVYEDFGTTGLTGDPAEFRLIEGVANNFLNFFRAEGHSDKGEQDQGSWGVGKTVFPRASRISSFFGFTVRSDDGRQLLLGRSILKYHNIHHKSFKSDGYFGLRNSDDMFLPIEQATIINDFKRAFAIKRTTEPGLSVVIPWYEVEGDNGIDRTKVLHAVLRGFFYPILMGHLSITIAWPGGEISLDSESIERHAESLEEPLRSELKSLVSLSVWAQTRTTSEFLTLEPPSPDRAQKWYAHHMPEELAKGISSSLRSKERVALRISMYVVPKGKNPTETHFDVFMETSENEHDRPVFIRDELIISDVKPPRVHHTRSIVIVEHGPLANLLRDAETPAHTQWNPGTGNFKDKYKWGPGAIDFVRYSVSEILRMVNQSDREADNSPTIDFFSVDVDESNSNAVISKVVQTRQTAGKKSGPGMPHLDRSPRSFRIERLRGGFGVKTGDSDAVAPSSLEISVAYDVRKGNPLNRYHPADFDLGRAPVRWKDGLQGLEVTAAELNRMQVKVNDKNFSIEVTGFDPERDLYVKVIAKENANVD